MKKYTLYILAFLLAAAVILLVLTGNNKKQKKPDQRITLRKQDKIPYGTFVAYKTLGHLFPKAAISGNRQEPGYWDSLSSQDPGQALIIITGKFNADENEMKRLVRFIEKGNDVFVSARTISYAAAELLDCRVNTSDIPDYLEKGEPENDSLNINLTEPPFEKRTNFAYPGKKLDASFSTIDETTTEILGEDDLGRPNFVRLRAGNGNFYIQLAPLAFSNYFLLYRDNIRYYEKVLSVISPDVTRLVWDEYYLNKKFLDEDNEKKQGWFSVLSRYPGLKAALLTAIFTLLLFVLLEMRRKQRYIPKMLRPKNESLDFVKTIGRLYFDKGDHKNLSRKMSAYFLEHVRNKYKLLTSVLDEDFIKDLVYKSGAEEPAVRGIVSFIKYLDDAPGIDHNQLADFHNQLEEFYKKA